MQLKDIRLVLYLDLGNFLSIPMPAISFLYAVIYLQWLMFYHTFLVPEHRISEDMPHQNFLFNSSEQIEVIGIKPVP